MNDNSQNIFSNYLENDKHISTSKASRKMTAFMKEAMQKNSMIDLVRSIREQCGLPLEGLDIEGYKTFISNAFDGSNIEAIGKVSENAQKICKQLDVSGKWVSTMETFIFTGKFDIENLTDNLVAVFDINYPPFSSGDGTRPKSLEGINPILISVSPYAGSNEIKEYITNMYKKVIEPLQKQYRNENSKIGKVRAKKPETQELYDFVELHKDKNDLAIQKLVREKFGKPMVYNDISKIKSIIKQRRS